MHRAAPWMAAFLALTSAPAAADEAPSPSPAPSQAPLQTSFYARTYEATQRSGTVQNGGNTFAVAGMQYTMGSNWRAGASYYYATADPLAPQSSVAKLLASYVSYGNGTVAVTAGNQLFASPWADSHFRLGLAPTAFQGVDAAYARGSWSLEGAVIDRFESRSATSFSHATLMNTPDGAPATSPGFAYGRASFVSPNGTLALNAYAYDMTGLAAFGWADARLALAARGWAPYVALQGGFERNAGASSLGLVRSELGGILFGVQPTPQLALSVAFDAAPWRSTNVTLPRGARCADSGAHPTYQLTGYDAYALPQGVAQCAPGGGGTTRVYYGGWAAPYTYSYAADPLFTTGLLEGLPDRVSPGTSGLAEADYTSRDRRFTLSMLYERYDYSNATAAQRTTEWDTLAAYRFARVTGRPYKGLLLRAGYITQLKSNVAYANGAAFLGGTPELHYARMQMEYAL